MAMPSPSDACQCSERTEAEHVADADFAFDGTVLGEAPKDPPKQCVEPSRANVRPGCLEIGVFDPTSCAEIARGGYIMRQGYDHGNSWQTKYADKGDGIVRARVCNITTGNYLLSDYNGPTRVFAYDAKVGGSVMLYAPIMYNAWRVRVRVDTPIKGDLPREVFIRSSGSGGGGCGIDTGPLPGERSRFFLHKFEDENGKLLDTDLGMNACSGWHYVDDTTPKFPPVLPPAATPQVPPAPASPPPPKKSGCNAGRESSLAFALLALVMPLRRRACRRARTS